MAKNNRTYLRIERKNLIAISVVFMLGALTLSLSSQITLTGSTPSPAGVYAGLLTTGGQAPDPTRDTILARDRGNVLLSPTGAGTVGIGTSNPATTLTINGVSTHNLLDVNGYASLGALYESGTRTYLVGGDPTYHWIMAGGTDEPDKNALGFNLASHTVTIGPNWTFNGAGGKAVQGSFSVTCPGSCDTSAYWNTKTIFVPFKPIAATCATTGFWTDQAFFPNWYFFYCDNAWVTLGPNYATFTYSLAGAPPAVTSRLGWFGINYMIVGQ